MIAKNSKNSLSVNANANASANKKEKVNKAFFATLLLVLISIFILSGVFGACEGTGIVCNIGADKVYIGTDGHYKLVDNAWSKVNNYDVTALSSGTKVESNSGLPSFPQPATQPPAPTDPAKPQDSASGTNWTGAAAGAAAAFGAGTGAGAASSYLVNSLFGQDPAKNQKTTGLASIMGGGLAGVMGLFCGPGCAMLGGLAGGYFGYIAGAAWAKGDTIKTIDRTITVDVNYVSIESRDAVFLNKPLFKMRGDLPTNPLSANKNISDVSEDFNTTFEKDPLDKVQSAFLFEGKFLKQEGPNTVAIYPIGFAKNGMPPLQHGILFVNYTKLDINKTVSDLKDSLEASPDKETKDVTKMSWESAKSESKVKRHDEIVANFLMNRANDKERINYTNAETVSFTLLFRDVNKEQMSFVLPNISCFSDTGISGATGIDAKPKVSFDWKYGWVDGYLCSDNNIYCDATQLTLEVLGRLVSADKELAQMDSTTERSEYQTYTLSPEIPDQVVPVEVNGDKFGEKVFTMSIKNISKEPISGYGLAYIRNLEINEDTLAWEGKIDLASESAIQLATLTANKLKTVSDLQLPVSRYQVKLVMEVETDANKKQYTLYSGSLDLRAKEVVGTSDEVMAGEDEDRSTYKLLHFKANLMADGYTTDFLNDFEYFATYQQFMGNVPKFYEGLMPDKLVFMPKAGHYSTPEGFRLNNAGSYNVDIVVKYKDAGKGSTDNTVEFGVCKGNDCKELSDNVEKVYVYLEPTAIEYNPLYYLPLNGTIGVVNGRIEREGYGVDFEEDPAGGFIQFNNEGTDNPLLLISPSLSSNSNPLVHVQLRRVEKSMETFNNSRRGTILSVSTTGTSGGTITRRIEFMPMVPYPVAMGWQKRSDGPAFAVYTLDSQDGAVNTGNRMIIWRQFCKEYNNFDDYGCEYFDGTLPIDHQGDIDTVGAKMNAPTGQMAANSYGLEVDRDSVIRDGKHVGVAMRGIVYAPEDWTLRMTPYASSDVMRLYSWNEAQDFTGVISGATNITQGSRVQLNTTFGSKISTLEDVYDLVGEGWICISGSKNNSNVSFWWNPAKVFDPNYNFGEDVVEDSLN